MLPRNVVLIPACAVLLAGSDAFAPAVQPQSARVSSTQIGMSNVDRREFASRFAILASGAVLAGDIVGANALDFDAFEKGEVEKDVEKCNPKLDPKCIPKLSDDEALCQYGGSGQKRGEACRRVKQAGGTLPEVKKEKSLGGAYAM
ncbi:hypothetical protein THAOC_13151 [Thalassiosira oceanica]|uniref:Uncharacterized protein n=1 Tax=Thalassiosira oceanica TaxID=159749 RepID=K0SI91_THAOC|nr:hypothetical protein THAOC_13151 [Thalassiosira oceanica]|eukprot:EJK65948.1 hypothetical protein THAOC_13151 [Thalassiosira oceanica]